jgi:soluble lytic murein transglycosylase
MRLILALLTVALTVAPLAAQPQTAQNPLTYVQAGLWAQARVAAGESGDPLAEKLIDWYRMLAPNAASATEIATFARQNPDWPLPTLLERRRQEAIVAEHDDATVAALCAEKKPTQTTAHGAALLRCADALANLGRGKEAGVLAREAWVNAISNPVTEAAFVRRFPGLMSAEDQWARFQRLIWDDAAAAQRQIANLDPAPAALATAALAASAGPRTTRGRCWTWRVRCGGSARTRRRWRCGGPPAPQRSELRPCIWRRSGPSAIN